MARPRFDTKQQAREWVWDRLEAEGQARFPFPPHGRIPNFKGARAAAQRLVEHDLLQGVDRVKVNPDSPQKPVREHLLREGVEVYVPTPRLKGGFKRLDPSGIPGNQIEEASALSKMDTYAQEVPLDRLPQMDLIVAGSVAVTAQGSRAGKGEGYSDLEHGILSELGHDPVPVVTTVHDLQVVRALPRDPTDVALSLIVTPEEAVVIEDPPPAPEGIDWSQLPDERIQEMPVLQELRARRQG